MHIIKKYMKRLPNLTPQLMKKSVLRYNNSVECYCLLLYIYWDENVDWDYNRFFFYKDVACNFFLMVWKFRDEWTCVNGNTVCNPNVPLSRGICQAVPVCDSHTVPNSPTRGRLISVRQPIETTVVISWAEHQQKAPPTTWPQSPRHQPANNITRACEWAGAPVAWNA